MNQEIGINFTVRGQDKIIQAALANTKLLSAGWKEGFEWACTAKPQEVFHAMQPTTMRHDFSRKDYSLKLKESLADEYLGSAVRKIWEDRYPELLIPDDEGYLSSGADQWLDGFSKGAYEYFVSMFGRPGNNKEATA
jgi:hypothetical protein